VSGYDDKGPAYANPACPDHNPEPKEGPMTPESVLKAMAEALAEKYTFTPEGAEERPLEERVNDVLAVKFPNGYLGTSMRPVTAREAAVEVMDSVVGPLLDLVFRMKEAMGALAKSHQEFIDEWARHDADASTLEAQHVAKSLIREVEVKEPADWDYVRRFSATPSEIHDILRSGLHPNVYLAYQQAIGKKIVAEAAEDLRKHGEESFPAAQRMQLVEYGAMFEMVLRCADRVERYGGPYPTEVVDPQG
jgi:hypothetical protein